MVEVLRGKKVTLKDLDVTDPVVAHQTSYDPVQNKVTIKLRCKHKDTNQYWVNLGDIQKNTLSSKPFKRYLRQKVHAASFEEWETLVGEQYAVADNVKFGACVNIMWNINQSSGNMETKWYPVYDTRNGIIGADMLQACVDWAKTRIQFPAKV